MRVLVLYATKYGSTGDIAEFLADHLQQAGLDADAQRVDAVDGLEGVDAVVLGSAAYMGRWLTEATAFARRHEAALAERPTWLFSSGPLGTEPTDDQGRDLREVTEPKEISTLRERIGARDHVVFFGALDPSVLKLRDRAIRALPAGRALLPEGDFRDWTDIEQWSRDIAAALSSDAAS